MATSPQIGDTQAVARNATVTSLPVSVVLAADLADADSAVNDALVSGKKLGAMVLVSDGSVITGIAIAQGVDTTSAWYVTAAGTAVTPA